MFIRGIEVYIDKSFWNPLSCRNNKAYYSFLPVFGYYCVSWFHILTLPSPLQATQSLMCLVLASILLPLPLHTGHVRVSGFSGLGNFRVGSFFRNLDVSWLGYHFMRILFFFFVVIIIALSHLHPPFSHARPADPHLSCLFILNVSASGAYPTSYCVVFSNVIVAGGGLD